MFFAKVSDNGLPSAVGFVGGTRGQVGAPEAEITVCLRFQGEGKRLPVAVLILHFGDENGLP